MYRFSVVMYNLGGGECGILYIDYFGSSFPHTCKSFPCACFLSVCLFNVLSCALFKRFIQIHSLSQLVQALG